MPWRVVIRFSFNGDNSAGTAMRNELQKVLAECGVTNTAWSTATWETEASIEHDVAAKLGEVLDKLANPAKVGGARGKHFLLDHLWIYIDQARPGATINPGTPRRPRGRPRLARVESDPDLDSIG